MNTGSMEETASPLLPSLSGTVYIFNLFCLFGASSVFKFSKQSKQWTTSLTFSLSFVSLYLSLSYYCFFYSEMLETDLEARMQMLRVSESQVGDTFAQRAEWFYQRRPVLLSLCLDLYNGYVSLLDRSHHTRVHQLKPISHQILQDECDSEVDSGSEISSEVQSTLSFQGSAAVTENVDELVSKLVTANLDKEILQHEMLQKEEQFHEASKTIELLKKFVMLLEMEKEVAMEENANLSYKLTSLLEENRELATEALFMKNEAVGLARCVLKMRDDHFHKVCLLQNRIYSLQASINLHQEDAEPVHDKVSAGCFGLDKYKTMKKKENKTKTEEKTGVKWLKKLNSINLFTKCSLNSVSVPSCCTPNLPN